MPGTGIVGETVAESEQGLRFQGFGICGGNYGQCEKRCKVFAFLSIISIQKRAWARVMRIISVKFRVYFHWKCGDGALRN